MIHLVSHLFNLQSYESEFLSFHIWLYQRLKNRRPDRNFCGKKIPDRRLHLLTLWTQHDWIRKLIFNHMLFPQVKEVSDNAHVGPTWIQFCGLMRQLSGRLKVDLTVGSTFVAGLSFFFFSSRKKKEEERPMIGSWLTGHVQHQPAYHPFLSLLRTQGKERPAVGQTISSFSF